MEKGWIDAALGAAMFAHEWWLGLVILMGFFLYYERIMLAEEAFLRQQFGAEFEAWAARTPAFFPSFRNWRPPALPFSFRNVLKREHAGFFALVVVFTVLEVLG